MGFDGRLLRPWGIYPSGDDEIAGGSLLVGIGPGRGATLSSRPSPRSALPNPTCAFPRVRLSTSPWLSSPPNIPVASRRRDARSSVAVASNRHLSDIEQNHSTVGRPPPGWVAPPRVLPVWVCVPPASGAVWAARWSRRFRRFSSPRTMNVSWTMPLGKTVARLRKGSAMESQDQTGGVGKRGVVLRSGFRRAVASACRARSASR
jgi:hypothetical protein